MPVLSDVPHARLSVITPECLRLEFSRDGRFIDEPSVVARERRPWSVVTASRLGEVIELATPTVHLRFINDGRPFHPHNTRAEVTPAGAEPFTWRPGDEPRRNLGGTLGTLDGVRGPVDLGHGLLTRDGWFLLNDSASPILVDGWPAPRPGAHSPDRVDWYLFAYGSDYRAALRALATLTGPVALPRRALLGSWYSRFWPYSADDFKEIVNQYAFHGFGLDVLVLDMDWHKPGWTGWSWNRSLIPDPPGLLRWLHGRGLAVTLNLHPAGGVGPHEDRYADFMRALGRDPASGETVPIDPADRRYVAALVGTVLKPLRDDGVDFWWLDWQQHPYTRSLPTLTNARQLNAVLAADSVETGARAAPGPLGAGTAKANPANTAPPGHPRRPALLSRWAGWGDQRHPVHFSGDAHAGWRSLAFQVPFTATAGNVLCCFWSHDIGGHFGVRNEECVARWVQFGAVSAALRLHSAHAAALDRRPWTCAPMFTESMRRAFALRASLMPTIYTAAHRCARESEPLLRPMYFDHSGDERAYAAPGQFMLGDLLAAPIVSPGLGERRVATQRVWFPGSIRRNGTSERVRGWCDWFTGARFKPGAEAVVAADIDEFPLYAPAGIPILMAAPDQPMGSSALRTLTIRIFPTKARSRASTMLYEDDGESTAHASGQFATTRVNARSGWTRVHVDVEPTHGSFAGQPPERAYIVELPMLVGHDPVAAVDGEPAQLELVPATPHAAAMCRVRVAPRPITRATSVSITFPRRGPGSNNTRTRLRRLRDALGEPVPETDVPSAIARLSRDSRNGARRAIGFDAVLAIGAGVAIVPESGRYLVIDSAGFADHGRFTLTVVDDVGGLRHDVRERVLAVKPGGAEAIEDPHPSLAAPPLGIRASRLVRAEFTSRGEPIAFETPVRTRLTPVRRWSIAGPFPFDDSRPLAEQSHAPQRREPAHWRPIAADPNAEGFDGRCAVDLTRHSDPGARLVYARATIRAPRDLAATLELESDDRLEAWLNGEKVFSMDPGDTMDSSRGSPLVSLLAGPNELLLKVTGGGGGFGFTAAFEAGQRLDDHAD